MPLACDDPTGLVVTPFRQMTHSIENATNCAESCTLGVVHKITQMEVMGETVAATYIPRAQGAISYIDYTEAQKIITPGFEGAQVGWAFAVVQDGRRYNGPATTAFGATDWTINGLCGLTAEDFGPKDGPHPNFTADGTELTFAYIRSNSNTSDIAAVTNVHGIDDFKVVIVKEAALP